MAFSFRKRKPAEEATPLGETTAPIPVVAGTPSVQAPGPVAVNYNNPAVGVVLLPPRYGLARRSRRLAQLSVVLGTLVISGMALGSAVVWRQTQEVTAARDVLQVRVNTLQSQVNTLQEYSEQAERLSRANSDLKLAMGPEVSWARVLNDLAMTVPSTAALERFDASLDVTAARNAATTYVPGSEKENGAEDEPKQSIGTLSMSGYSINRYSPGVETVLTQFMDVQSYSSVFLPSTKREELVGARLAVDDPDVRFDGKYTFDLKIDISPAALTGRYRNGLPEVGGSS